MVDPIEKIKSRLLTTNTDAWNHGRRMVLLTPILVLVGGVAGVALQVGLAHRGYEARFGVVLKSASMTLSLLVGYVALALID